MSKSLSETCRDGSQSNMINIVFDQPLFILNEFKTINKTFCQSLFILNDF